MALAFLLLALASALLPECRARRAAALATVSVGLALAGSLAGAPAPATPGFQAVAAALVVVAELLCVGAAAATVRGRSAVESPAGLAAIVGGALGLAWSGAGLISTAPMGDLLLALPAVAGIGGCLVLLGRATHFRNHEPSVSGSVPKGQVAGLLAGTVAAAVGPDVGLVFVGAIATAASAYLIQRSAHGRRPPVAPALTLTLLAAWWLMTTIAGHTALPLEALASVPLSPAAERLLAPLLLLAGWALAGLWPFHRQLPGALSAPAGAFLMARVAIPALPEGLDHWRPLAMPLVVLGVWHAALTGRRSLVAVGMAWVGVLAPEGRGLPGAALLLAAGLTLEALEHIERRAGPVLPVRVIARVLVASGSLIAVAAGLRGEVSYTVLAVAAIVAGLGRGTHAQASTASAPRAIEPSA